LSGYNQHQHTVAQTIDDVEIARPVVAGGDGVLKLVADKAELVNGVFLMRRDCVASEGVYQGTGAGVVVPYRQKTPSGGGPTRPRLPQYEGDRSKLAGFGTPAEIRNLQKVAPSRSPPNIFRLRQAPIIDGNGSNYLIINLV